MAVMVSVGRNTWARTLESEKMVKLQQRASANIEGDCKRVDDTSPEYNRGVGSVRMWLEIWGRRREAGSMQSMQISRSHCPGGWKVDKERVYIYPFWVVRIPADRRRFSTVIITIRLTTKCLHDEFISDYNHCMRPVHLINYHWSLSPSSQSILRFII